MNILIIAAWHIVPPDDGASITIFNRIKCLQELGHRVFGCFLSPRRQPETQLNTREDFTILRFKEKGCLPNRFHPRIPYFARRNRLSTEELRELRKLIDREHIGCVCFESTPTGEMYYQLRNDLQAQRIHAVFYSHNLDYRDMRNLACDTGNPLKKAFYFLEYLRLRGYEKRLIRCFRVVFTISQSERETIIRINPHARVLWLPHILPQNSTPPTTEERRVTESLDRQCKGAHTILFTGILDKSSNIRAVCWFAKQVLPRIVQHIPDALFLVAGKNPSQEIKHLAVSCAPLRLYADVPSTRPFLWRADCIVVPVFNNAGVKIKLLEALQAKRPLVSTPQGTAGSGLGDVIPTGTDAEEFAARCIEALSGRLAMDETFSAFEKHYSRYRITAALEHEVQQLQQAPTLGFTDNQPVGKKT